MKRFSALLDTLLLTPSRNQKLAQIVRYFHEAPDPDRGYALAVLTGSLSFANVKASLLRDLVLTKVDPVLFEMSYDYVGDLAETIALIWPDKRDGNLPALSALIRELETIDKSKLPAIISDHLSCGNPTERWAIVKLATGNLRVGVSERLAKTALAEFGQKPLEEIEHLWHGLQCPYSDLFAWLEGMAPTPHIRHHRTFHPLMLSNPIDEGKDLAALNPADYEAEWKWDGIRVQLVLDEVEKAIFSRTGENIAHTFPDLIAALSGHGVLDGELLVGRDFAPLPFNALQQRLNRKTVTRRIIEDYPAFVRLYDILFEAETDVRGLPFSERRVRLEKWLRENPQRRIDLSAIIPFLTWEELGAIRRQGAAEQGHEGIMLKRKDSLYVPGRPKGPWFKWKRDPHLIDTVLMYAQRGHGKRSSFYSDYTFGVWDAGEIVPVGKAYFGFTDLELQQLDRWVRKHTVNRFGPVREVSKELVLEVAFDSAQFSPRHRSGIALRFPRINRIRWDKPANEADNIEQLRTLIE
ncbi:MAG TPA: cisplatin damage response ATP-dependent DNA ligase [Chthoniobacterales bacterium]|jgi:DNA ligase-1|nr:cisplatin damage response ATP-dependent DNA ligase [Chthoniobacterales bacterium]